jgi:hypothetical protein
MSVEKINSNFFNNNFDYLKKFKIANNVLDSNISLRHNICDTESNQDFIFNNKITNLPIGTIILYSATKIPDGFLKCNGRKYLITLYTELFNIIGNQDPNDLSKFFIPKLISPNKNFIYIIKY